MKLKLFAACAVALAFAAAPLAASAQQPTVWSPNGNASAQNLCVGAVGASCTPAGGTVIASANFTTPSGTTGYTTGQLVANSATAGSVTPMQFTVCPASGGTGMVRRARFKTADSGFSGKTVKLELYKDSPTPANGDHAAWSTSESNWIGEISVTVGYSFTDPLYKGIGAPGVGNELNFDCATGSRVIYGLMTAGEAITPQGGKVHTWTLETLY